MLARAWYIDDTLAEITAGPGTAAFEGTATFDRRRRRLGQRRRLPGPARCGPAAGGADRQRTHHALGVAVGAVAPVGLFLSQATFWMALPALAASAGSLAAELTTTTDPDFILTSLIVVPAAGALVVATVTRYRPELVRQLAFLFSAVTGAITVWLLIDFERSDPGFQFTENHTLVADLGISWHLGLDGISLFLVVLTGLLFPLVILAVIPEHDPKPYYAWLLLQAGCLGVFVALDLFVFFVFFELVLVPMYFIGGWGHGNRTYVAVKFFLYTMLGSAFMLVGILVLVILTARETGEPITFDLITLADTQALAPVTARWVFLAFAVAFAVKVPIFPVHTWLPDAHTEAPTAGSVILAGSS